MRLATYHKAMKTSGATESEMRGGQSSIYDQGAGDDDGDNDDNIKDPDNDDRG